MLAAPQLQLSPGVLIRADTAPMLALRLIERAHHLGWANSYYDDTALANAAHTPNALTSEQAARLTQGGRDALAWLDRHVPDGWRLTRTDNAVVLDRAQPHDADSVTTPRTPHSLS